MKIQQFLKKKSQRKLAFSLVELAIVMLIIGILAAAVSSGGEYIRDTRLANARALTNSSPVHSTKGLAVWYDAVSEASFAESEADDGADITTWFDINSQGKKVDAAINHNNVAGTEWPKYVADGINNLPVVRFDSATDHMEFDNSKLTSSHFTIFAVAKREENSGGAEPYGMSFIGMDSNGGVRALLGVSAGAKTQVRYGLYDGSTTSPVNAPTNLINGSLDYGNSSVFFFKYKLLSSGDRTVKAGHCPNNIGCSSILDATFDSSIVQRVNFAGVTYIGGSDDSGVGSSNANTIDIGEIIIFNRYLRQDEIDAIMEYLSQKWKIGE